MATAILGISAFYHDSAAALIIDGRIIAAAQEERFTRIRHDAAFPKHAVEYVLSEAGLQPADLTAIAFYDKPLLKFERLLETYHAFAPKGLQSFARAMPVWVNEKLFTKKILRKALGLPRNHKIPFLFPEHHLSHAASAFYPSPFEEAAILTVDGVGEWATTTICQGTGNQVKIMKELHFPHSIGLLYSACTYYLGFKVNSGEYKMMGLAPYGDALSPQTKIFKEKISAHLVDLREDGSILLNMEYFNFATGLTMAKKKQWETIFGFSHRKSEAPLEQLHANFALAIQQVIEEILLALIRTTKQLTNSNNLVMAGGVALNCVSNSKIVAAGLFDNVWIQPASGDAGGALGAAYAAHHIWAGQERKPTANGDAMQNAYLGPQYTDNDIKKVINRYSAVYHYEEDSEALTTLISRQLATGKVVGWFQGRMEFGPRALGNRSILADPRNPQMQQLLNEKIKNRESFRPFAPSVLAEDTAEYFEPVTSSPYMLFVATVKETMRNPEPPGYEQMDLFKKLYHPRSSVPAVTHLDYSARVQTVAHKDNPLFWQLIHQFKVLTGCPMLINTSFNQRGEPIVCTPEEAYRCFMQTGMDYLVIGQYIFTKDTQPPFKETHRSFDPD